MALQTPPQTAASSVAGGGLPTGKVSGLTGGATVALPPAGAANGLVTGGGSVATTSLIEETGAGNREPDAAILRLSPPLARLPVGLEVMVPVREFRVRHLLAMAPGEVIESRWANGEDLPLSAGDIQLAWSEFEVVDGRLAVRVTRLA